MTIFFGVIMMDQFLEDQVNAVESDILALNAAIQYLLSNPTAEYTLNTGQSTQRVRRQDLSQLQEMRAALYGERDALKNRTSGAPLVSHAPGW